MIRVFLISNMYPSEENPSYGVFVKNFETQMNSDEDMEVSQKVVIDQQGGGKIQKIIRYLRFYSQIIKVLLVNKFDMVYIHFPVFVAPLLSFIPLRHKKLVLNFHGSDVIGQGVKFRILEFFTKFMVKRASLVVAPSSFLAAQLKKRLAVSEKKIFISPSGGVDKKYFYPIVRVKARKKIKIDDQFTIGFISRFDEGKGWDVFLESISILKNDYDISVQAVVVGDGSQKDDFFAKIQALQIEENIRYFGRKKQEELPYYFSSLDIFVASSTLMESLGLIGLEAMSCGVPVAGSDRAGIATYVVDDFNGYLFKPGNPSELAKVVNRYYVSDVSKQKLLSMQAIQTAKEYESEYVNKKLINKLQSLL